MPPSGPARRERIRGGLLAASLVPRTSDGRLEAHAHLGYVERLWAAGVTGFAVWAHTGRGSDLTDGERALVLEQVRSTAPEAPVVAAVGGSAAERAETFGDLARTMAVQARLAVDRGADAVMCFPPPRLLAPTIDDVRELHRRTADACGSPVIAFVLYEEGGGRLDVLDAVDRIVGEPEVMAVKIATLDSPIGYQDAVRTVRAAAPDVLVLSGEDRFLGASLQWGADSALVGIAAVRPRVTVELVEAWRAGEARRFLECAARVDELAQATFARPMSGYVRRLLWLARRDGMIAAEAAYDSDGGVARPAERADVDAYARRR